MKFYFIKFILRRLSLWSVFSEFSEVNSYSQKYFKFQIENDLRLRRFNCFILFLGLFLIL